MKQRQLKRTESIAYCALAIALCAASAQITLTVGLVPFTLQTLMLTFVLLLFPAREALISVFGYLLLGAIGVPVFAGLSGGIGSIMGPTGGFLIGFGVGAVAAVALLKVWKQPKNTTLQLVREVAAAVVFLGISYVMGFFQLMYVANLDLMSAFMAAIAPFVIFDLLKMAVAVGLAHSIRNAIPALRALNQQA